jgi:hypothetical protein
MTDICKTFYDDKNKREDDLKDKMKEIKSGMRESEKNKSDLQ